MPIIPAGISAGTVAAVGAGVSAAGSVGGALINSASAGNAASLANATSNYAIQAQEAEHNDSISAQQAFLNAGYNASDLNNDLIGRFQGGLAPYQQALNAAVPQAMTEANLVNTPGYQFNLSQGLQATQSAAAARGLGVSGAALKGAASYATGLADSTYQNQFANQQTLYGDASNNLSQYLAGQGQAFSQNQQVANLGGNVAVQQGTQNQNFANSNSNLLTSNANAQGAAGIAGGNALASGLNGVGNAATTYGNQLIQQNYLGSNGSQYASQNGTTGVGLSAGSGGLY